METGNNPIRDRQVQIALFMAPKRFTYPGQLSEEVILSRCASSSPNTVRGVLSNMSIILTPMQSEEDEGDPFADESTCTYEAAARRMYDILANNPAFHDSMDYALRYDRIRDKHTSNMVLNVEEIARRTRLFDCQMDDVEHFKWMEEAQPLFAGERNFVNKHELTMMPLLGKTHAVFAYYCQRHNITSLMGDAFFRWAPNCEQDSTNLCLRRERNNYTYFTTFHQRKSEWIPPIVAGVHLQWAAMHGAAMRRAHAWFQLGYKPVSTPQRHNPDRVLYLWWKLRQYVKTWAIYEYWCQRTYAPSDDQIHANLDNILETFDAVYEGISGVREGEGKTRLQKEDTRGWADRRQQIAEDDNDDWLMDSDEEV